ncbi:hypothetical protein J8F10_33455 [Gemmata sp. G18]|uniref:F-box/LRR-repeat protein 15-like leucin rich repeat domain-containing protein n=1 Tax=Gemmata palustris TaxID=2822762 RepID=A0ABS5C2F7_9BACT|nr:hypothetical protein [Gemmata palustris]MBP3960160.1 hypothetical protein [Gemmata palustris]
MRALLTSSLVLGLTSLALAQPSKPTAISDEQKAIDAIAKAGGKGEIDPKLPEAGRVAAKFEAATDAALVGLKKYPHIGSVDVFNAAKCTEKGYTALKDLPNLRRLVLSKSDLTVARVNAIAQCAQLRELRIPNAGLTDTELVGLKKLALLESLDISENPQVTDKGMATIKTLERLRALYLSKTAVSDKGLFELKTLDGLRTLYAGSTKITADGAEKFADEMPNLRVVRQ